MTEPVILTDCDACGERTAHAREQQGKADPPRIVTERVCSECGATDTTEHHIQRDE